MWASRAQSCTDPQITEQPQGASYCQAFTALEHELCVTATGHSWYDYQWQRNGEDIPGANDKCYTATEPGVYQVVVFERPAARRPASRQPLICLAPRPAAWRTTPARCSIRRPCASQGGTPMGQGTDCALIDCTGSSTEACCFNDGSCHDLAAVACVDLGGQPQGLGSSCDTTNCSPSEAGACCLPDGTCQELTEDACLALGGISLGADIRCDQIYCPAQAEACCFADGGCEELQATVCQQLGGSPQGVGTTCQAVNCPVLDQACCWPEGACTEVKPVVCTSLGGSPMGPGSSCRGRRQQRWPRRRLCPRSHTVSLCRAWLLPSGRDDRGDHPQERVHRSRSSAASSL